jgi:hypothetical protein
LLPPDPDVLIGGHPQDVATAAVLHAGAQPIVPPVDLIGQHPGARSAAIQRPLQQQPADLGLGQKRHLLGDPSLPPALRILRPGLGQVQRPVDEGTALGSGVGQQHPHLAVLSLAQAAAVLPTHPRRLGALLRDTGLIENQHPRGIAQMGHDVPPQDVAHRVDLPHGASQQVLHPVRRAVPSDLRELPPVLALHRTHQRLEVLRGSLARVPARKVRTETVADLLQPVRPPPHRRRFHCHPGRLHHCHDPSSRARTDHAII